MCVVWGGRLSGGSWKPTRFRIRRARCKAVCQSLLSECGMHQMEFLTVGGSIFRVRMRGASFSGLKTAHFLLVRDWRWWVRAADIEFLYQHPGGDVVPNAPTSWINSKFFIFALMILLGWAWGVKRVTVRTLGRSCKGRDGFTSESPSNNYAALVSTTRSR